MAKRKANSILKVDENKLIEELLEVPCVGLSQVLAYGVLDSGHNYQIHVTITTDEDNFIDED